MRRCVGAVLGLVFAGGHAVGGIPENRLPPRVSAALSKPSSLELLSLEPHPMSPHSAATFHGWKVLGRTKVLDVQVQKSIVTALNQGIAEPPRFFACFDPRHGIRLTSGNDLVELVICFECHQIDIFLNGKSVAGVRTGEAPQPLLNRLLVAAKVPLDPGFKGKH